MVSSSSMVLFKSIPQPTFQMIYTEFKLTIPLLYFIKKLQCCFFFVSIKVKYLPWHTKVLGNLKSLILFSSCISYYFSELISYNINTEQFLDLDTQQLHTSVSFLPRFVFLQTLLWPFSWFIISFWDLPQESLPPGKFPYLLEVWLTALLLLT